MEGKFVESKLASDELIEEKQILSELAIVDLSTLSVNEGILSTKESIFSTTDENVTVTSREIKIDKITYNIIELNEELQRLQTELDTFVSAKQREIDLIHSILNQINK
ncbi:MAG: hypothetical protein BWY74_01690 [Firmicutes bacterium ADurb.Bin419]|nr:MAG: hypothetical protein BWY74_01690 [Firmicutes bacterium ADurb.Bin419]